MRASALEVPGQSPSGLVQAAWRRNPPLTALGAGCLLLLCATLVGLAVDDRVITGAPAWLKPAKFAISITLYAWTLLWLLTFVQRAPRVVRVVSWCTAIALAAEMLLIAWAVATGTTSHFNVSSAVHAGVWGAMAFFIVVTWIAALVTAMLLIRQRLPDAAFAWGLRLGLLVAAVGMGIGFFMTGPTPEQLALAQRTGELPVIGAHAVGIPDGGAGLPVTGWSTVGGDLRVPHFVGLHALQVLPVVGFLTSRAAPGRMAGGHRVVLVVLAALGYAGLTTLLTSQALRGQPVTAPDATTMLVGGAALAVLLVAVLGVVGHALTSGRR